MNRTELAPQSGTSFILRSGQKLKVIDVYGEQVADLLCFAIGDKSEYLSSGRTIDYNETIYQTKGHSLYSNKSRVMFEIIEDTVGRHDFLVTPCSLVMFHVVHNNKEYHPSCEENLCKAFAGNGIFVDGLPTSFNIFMNVGVAESGKIWIAPPRSKAGDYIVLEAKMDLIVGLTACSDEQTNNGSVGPIAFEIF